MLKYPYATPVTTVRYVRMYGTARVTGYGYSIYEFAVYGVPSGVVTQAPAITDGPPPTTGTTGVAYSFTYTASGTPIPVFKVSSGSLPPGVTLNSTTGLLSGSPTAAGVFTGTVTATNGIGDGVTPAASQNFSITLTQLSVAPAITNGPPPTTGTTGVAYSFTYTASGYPTPVFNVSSGALPGGLTLSTTGLLSGTPTATGVFTGTVTATNGVGDGVTPAASQNFSITVSQAPTPPTNVALDKFVTVSSTESTAVGGANAVDGSTSTRWSSLWSDPQWIEVDLGDFYAISEIDLNWETACGKNYQIQTSNDGTNWTVQNNVTGNTTTGLLTYPYATPPTARYVRMYGTARATGYGYSLYELTVYSNTSTTVPPPVTITNLALGKAVTVSSLESASLGGANAVDGNTATRWSSGFSDPQWIVVDLGASHTISEIDLNWETACGKNYLLQTSADGTTWTTQTTVTGNVTAGLLTYTYATAPTARYVRMYGTARATPYGYSLYEFSVYGL